MKGNQPRIYFVLLLAGILLRLVNYFSNPGLWLDEALLALNFIEKSWIELFQPLEHNQVAPILFLMAEKTSVMLLGPGELPLRLFPLLCSIISLPLFFRVARRLLNSDGTALTAFLIFALSPLQIRYAAEVKQYACDVTVILLILYLFLKFREHINSKSMGLLMLSGTLALFLSHIAVLVLFAIGLYWMITSIRNRSGILKIAAVLAVWIAAFGLLWLFFIRGHDQQAFMMGYWKDHFMPLNPFSPDAWHFFNTIGRKVFFEIMLYNQRGFPGVVNFIIITCFLVVYVIGLSQLMRKAEMQQTYLLTVPLFIHLLVSATRLYPFDTRLVLYLAPLIIMTFAIGLSVIIALTVRVSGRTITIMAVIIPIICIFTYKLAVNFPVKIDGTRECLRYISSHHEDGQPVYVQYYAYSVFEYYERTGSVDISGPVIAGIQPEEGAILPIDDLHSMEGYTEVWVLISHLFDEPAIGRAEEELHKAGAIRHEFTSTAAGAWLVAFRDGFQFPGSQ